MSRVFRFGAALACALALVGAPPAKAQRYHGGHGHYHGGGFGHYGHGHYGHYGHYGHHHHGWRFGISLGLGYGGFGYGGLGYGGYGLGYGGFGYPAYYSAFPAYYSSYYSGIPAVYSSYPAYSVGYSYSPAVITSPATVIVSDPPPVSSTVIPAQPAAGEGQVLKPNAATMEVRVPDAEAEVWVDGRPTKARGRTRTLVSPELVPGKAYAYKLTAAWTRDGRRVTEERTVQVAAGKTSVVDFTPANGKDDLPFPKELPLPKPPPEPK